MAPTCPDAPAPDTGFCPSIFEGEVRDIHLELSDDTLAALQEDYVDWPFRFAADRKPYHDVDAFEMDCEPAEDVKIRLKGNPCCSWTGDKLQFVLSFNKVDRDGRFHGMRKLAFDAPFYDPTLLSERLAFSALTDMGATSSCAHHARIHINGELYGTYTMLEPIDKEYLQRRYGDDDEATLYKFDYDAARVLPRTNEETDDGSAYIALRALDSWEELEEAYDMDQAMQTWAAEAVLLQADGFWAGSLNFYLYPSEEGWKVLPWDMDHAFDFWSPERDPLVRRDYYSGLTAHLDVVLAHPVGRQRFIDAVKANHAAYDLSAMLRRLDTWAEETRPSIDEEPHKPFLIAEYDSAVDALHDAIIDRHAWLTTWTTEN